MKRKITALDVVAILFLIAAVFVGLNALGVFTPAKTGSSIIDAEVALLNAKKDPCWDCDFNGRKSGYDFFLHGEVQGGEVRQYNGPPLQTRNRKRNSD